MKITKINSCFHCYERFTENNLPSDFCKEIEKKLGEYSRNHKIHPKCTLEDYQQQKTQWLPLSELKENNIAYWLLDQNNIAGVGHQEEDRFIVYNLDKTPDDFDKPVMFAEIKPPELPR